VLGEGTFRGSQVDPSTSLLRAAASIFGEHWSTLLKQTGLEPEDISMLFEAYRCSLRGKSFMYLCLSRLRALYCLMLIDL
jgi:hypothetical protein